MLRREDQFLAQVSRLSEQLNTLATQYDDLLCDDLKRAMQGLREQLRPPERAFGTDGSSSSAAAKGAPAEQPDARR